MWGTRVHSRFTILISTINTLFSLPKRTVYQSRDDYLGVLHYLLKVAASFASDWPVLPDTERRPVTPVKWPPPIRV